MNWGSYFLGVWTGACLMAGLGWALTRPQPHQTLPRPAESVREGMGKRDPADLIPPQSLPTRPQSNWDE